jgi:NAD(P)-dependent dehydrogenase (short-subunit alcohol dehydrogenase family)
LGSLDVLVNNAAFQYHASDFGDLTEEHFDTTLKTNLTAISSWRRRPYRT